MGVTHGDFEHPVRGRTVVSAAGSLLVLLHRLAPRLPCVCVLCRACMSILSRSTVVFRWAATVEDGVARCGSRHNSYLLSFCIAGCVRYEVQFWVASWACLCALQRVPRALVLFCRSKPEHRLKIAWFTFG